LTTYPFQFSHAQRGGHTSNFRASGLYRDAGFCQYYAVCSALMGCDLEFRPGACEILKQGFSPGRCLHQSVFSLVSKSVTQAVRAVVFSYRVSYGFSTFANKPKLK